MNTDFYRIIKQVNEKMIIDKYCILNESELQSRIYLALNEKYNETIQINVPNNVIFPDDKRKSLINNRVFREMLLNPKLGRNSPKPDILIFKPEQLTGVPKENKAISSWTGTYERIVETKFNANKKRSVDDIKKYPESLHDIIYCINFNHNLKGINISDNYIEFGGNGNINNNYENRDISETDVIDCILKVHNKHIMQTGSMIREKDFESWISYELELKFGNNGCIIYNGNNVIGYTTAIRNQISSSIFKTRRHDILIVNSIEFPSKYGKTQNVLSSSFEIEIKTSHSDTHNWFRGRITDELNKMRIYKNITGGIPIFVLFRFGSPIFVDDYYETVNQFPEIKFLYLCSNGEKL